MATQTISKKVSLTSASTTIGSPTLTVASTIAVFVGAVLEHANIPAGTTILSINSYTSITMSANATATSSSQTVVALNPDSVNVDDIALYGAATVIQKWSSYDTLTINDGITVNVNTDQTKFWKTITINEGILKIANSSTTTGISFAMGRSTGTTLNAITTATGKASIEVLGDWISIGTGNGLAGQTLTTPFRDYIPAVWVETFAGSGVYDKWVNITGMYGDADKYMQNGLELAYNEEDTGHFFVQTPATNYVYHFTLSGGSSLSTSRIITVSSTTGVIPGASITGTGITANSVVQRVVSATQLELNVTPSTSAGPNTYTICNPYRAQLEAQIVFGDGFNGSLIPTGANVRVPNIMVTDFTPANIQTSSAVLGAVFVLNIGNLKIDKALFDESYFNLAQAQSVSIKHTGRALSMAISECYDFELDDVAYAVSPNRFYYGSSWLVRELSWGAVQNNVWSYISGAVINDVIFAGYDPSGRMDRAASITFPGAMLAVSYTADASFSNLWFYAMHKSKPYGVAINASSNVNNCTFTNIKTYNVGIAVFQTSINNTVSNCTVRTAIFNMKSGFATTGYRVLFDPITKNELVDGQKYYFKIRSFRHWINRETDSYFEGRTISCKPYLGSKYFPPQFGAINTGSNSNTLTWVRQEPQTGTTAWEIFRSTTEGFTQRDASTRIATSATETTTTYVDNVATLLPAPVNGTTYYYVLRKWDATSTVASCTGSSGGLTITTSNNFNRARNVINCNAADGSTTLITKTSNFVSGGIVEGMPVSGTGIQAGTTVVSVENSMQVTLSLPTTAEIKGTTIYFGLIPGMLVTGTNIAQNARIVSVDSNTQLTLDTANIGAVSATLTFANVNESAEQEVYTSGAAVTATNYCLYSSDQTSSTWVKTSITPTAATGGYSPYDAPITTSAPTVTTDRLVSAANNATSVQTVAGLSIGVTYTASIYVRCDATAGSPTKAGALIFGGTTTTFNATRKWQRITATFQATATSHTFTIRIDVSGTTIYVAAANVHVGTVALPPIETTTTAVTITGAQEFLAILPFTRSYAGATKNKGVELRLNSAPAGTHWSNIYMGTTYDFVPTDENKVATTLDERLTVIGLSNANGNTFTDITQMGFEGDIVNIAYLVGSSDNKFINFNNFSLGMAGGIPVAASNLSNNNLFHNWEVRGARNYIASFYPITSVNNCSGLTFQNIKIDTYDRAMSNQFNDTILKGFSGGASLPAASGTTYAIGSTTDSVAIAYTAVYDYIFNELYTSPTTGRLHLCFNASSKPIKPYEILSGAPLFGNSGRLYMKYGDVIEYTWPHKIYGVSGFQNLLPLRHGLDLGNNTNLLFGLLVEYSINTGSGYSAYKEATGINLSGELVSASTGFYLKIKITAREFMKVGNPSTQFVIGETINGAISGATATVTDVENFGTIANTIAISNRVGTFTAAENIRSGVTTRAANVATNTYAIGPSFTSYIDGLELFTTVDQSVLYPVSLPELTLTGLKIGSEIRAYVGTDPATAVEIGGVESCPSSTFSFVHQYGGVAGYIQILHLDWLPIKIDITYPIEDSSIPIQQSIDRQYNNPA